MIREDANICFENQKLSRHSEVLCKNDGKDGRHKPLGRECYIGDGIWLRNAGVCHFEEICGPREKNTVKFLPAEFVVLL